MPVRPGWARHPLAINADHVFAALERGSTVELIATVEPDLIYCDAALPLHDALYDPSRKAFDFLPVRRDGRIVGLLRRAEMAAARPRAADPGMNFTVADAMQVLDESILISADAGLLTFISQADQQPSRLVIKGTRITGIVTISDLQKLPVRPVLFTLVTHVELLLSEVLRVRFGAGDGWLDALAGDRRSKIDGKWRKLHHSNMAVDRLVAAEFGDKSDALMRSMELPLPKNQARKELYAIEELRNSVTHAGDYALTPATALRTVEAVQLAQIWIERLERLLGELNQGALVTPGIAPPGP